MNRCPTGKQSYPTANAAWRVIRFLTSKTALHTHKHNGKSGGHAYRCQDCGQWHMTSHRRRELLKAHSWRLKQPETACNAVKRSETHGWLEEARG